MLLAYDSTMLFLLFDHWNILGDNKTQEVILVDNEDTKIESITKNQDNSTNHQNNYTNVDEKQTENQDFPEDKRYYKGSVMMVGFLRIILLCAEALVMNF